VERGEVVWEPGSSAFKRSHVARFMRAVGKDDYAALHRWSIDDPEAFWQAVADHLDVRWTTPPSRVLADGDRAMPGARWFPDATLNYAHQALAPWLDGEGRNRVAVVERSQTRDRRELTGSQLVDAVARCRAGLQRLGVTKGDRVAAYSPNITETLVAVLATASLGAIWSSCAPEFGTRSVIDRLSQIRPKVLLAVDGYRYGTRDIDRRDELAAVVAALPSVEHVATIPYLHDDTDDGWARLTAEPAEIAFDPVAADHPLYVLFSSGTTGLPKPIVHGHAGITVEHLKTLALHHDLGPGDRFSWFTTTGWMMWNYVVSGLLVGATIVLFDGDPGHPDLHTLWRLAADERLDVLGVSAPFLMACRKAGIHPGSAVDLSALRAVGSTGAPLPPEGFRWVSEDVGSHVQVQSVSGGTDVCTAFVGMSPVLPVRAGEISCRMLGCDVRAVDPDGEECPPGVQGELVIGSPMPSMPVGFWNDDDGSRYRAAYFEDFPGLWRHGDWVTFFDDGACIISGRSDATLNRGGVRLGTSDFYAVVESLPEVADSLVVHLEAANELVLFVALAAGAELDGALRARINAALREQLSPRHVPDRIEAVPGVPRTLSGKKLEVPVKRILTGTPVETAASSGSLANPESLEWFARLGSNGYGEVGSA
jgi:acetoacetyl-CoA synthetase